MAIRILKAVLVAFVALLALIYATQNIVNLDAAYRSVAGVLSMDGHEIYPQSLGPSIASPYLTWLALIVILIGEFATGLLAARGAWDLWMARRRPAQEFNAAKTYAILGCGVGLIVWFGLFTVIGGAWFQMWQTEAGDMSLMGAFQLLTSIGIVLLFVNMGDAELAGG